MALMAFYYGPLMVTSMEDDPEGITSLVRRLTLEPRVSFLLNSVQLNFDLAVSIAKNMDELYSESLVRFWKQTSASINVATQKSLQYLKQVKNDTD